MVRHRAAGRHALLFTKSTCLPSVAQAHTAILRASLRKSSISSHWFHARRGARIVNADAARFFVRASSITRSIAFQKRTLALYSSLRCCMPSILACSAFLRAIAPAHFLIR